MRKATFILVAFLISIQPSQSALAGAQPENKSQVWTLLITPILSGIIAIFAAIIAIKIDARKSVNQELIRKRISIYDAVAPKLNDLLCFFLVRGAWKALPPSLMIQRKRELDQAFYVYGPLFSEGIFRHYDVFINLCFRTFTGVGRDACLRANRALLEASWGMDWKSEWNGFFVESADAVKHKDIRREYDRLLRLLADEIGAERRSKPRKSVKALP